TLNGTASNGWQPVLCNGGAGYVSAQFLTINAAAIGGALAMPIAPTTTTTTTTTSTPARTGATPVASEVLATPTPGETMTAAPGTPVPSTSATPLADDPSVPAGSNPSFAGAPLPIADSLHSANSSASAAAYDGDPGTSWTSTGTTPGQATITFDLGAPQELTGIRWMMGAPTGADAMTIQTSIDGQTWSDLSIASNRQPGTWEGFATGDVARYVRFVVSNPNGLQTIGNIAEVEIWGTGVIVTPETTPTVEPTATATATSTAAATSEPRVAASPTPTETLVATLEPTATSAPTDAPTLEPSATMVPTEAPTLEPPTPTTEPTPAAAFASFTAWIGGTGGDGALLRQAADPNGAILTTLPEGSEVTVTGPASGEWTPVNALGMDGFVFSSFVVSTAPVPTPTPAVAQPGDLATATPEGAGESAIANDAPVAVDTVPAETVAPTEVPQVVTRTVSIPVAADASVSSAQPDTPNAGEVGGVLMAGGPDGAQTVLTFSVEGIGAGTVVSARLVITGSGGSSGSGGSLLVGPGVWFDEYGVTANQVANAGLGGAGWVDAISPGGQTVVDVTGIVTGDGTISFVIAGTPDTAVGIGSKETGAPAYLELTVEDSGS
ncbi:MAG: discoidin domain-containing protein, partial [Thermomicrobiales bacterium]